MKPRLVPEDELPCPTCGGRLTIRGLTETIESLEFKKARLQRRSDGVGGRVIYAPQQHLSVDVCAVCGTAWRTDARVAALDLLEQIRCLNIEVEDPITLLGESAEAPPIAEALRAILGLEPEVPDQSPQFEEGAGI